MFKFTSVVLCVVAATLSKVDAVSEEEKQLFREALQPIIISCATEHGVSDGDIKAAKQAGSADSIKPCFVGCVMKNIELLDDKGMFDVEKGLGMLKKYLKSEEDIAKFSKITKDCASVNDQEVSDGEAGCDRAKLLIACTLEHNVELPL